MPNDGICWQCGGLWVMEDINLSHSDGEVYYQFERHYCINCGRDSYPGNRPASAPPVQDNRRGGRHSVAVTRQVGQNVYTLGREKL